MGATEKNVRGYAPRTQDGEKRGLGEENYDRVRPDFAVRIREDFSERNQKE